MQRTVTALAILACSCGGGGDKDCGPTDTTPAGLSLSDGSATNLFFAELMAGANNDCTPTGSGVISLTIQGAQTDGVGFITFCIPRPQDLGSALALGSDAPGDEPAAILEDLEAATTDGCMYSFDPSATLTGTVRATGICDDGTNPAGFALVVAATLSVTGSGGSGCGTLSVQLAGTAAVAHQQ
jgi:hypothetical protein